MGKYLSKNWFCCGVIGLFSVLLWGQTVRYGFVWDDALYITQNKNIRSLANVPKFFHRMDVQSGEFPSIGYRPLRNTVYALLYALEGSPEPQPWIFHLANVLLHAGVAMLLFLVALLLGRQRMAALFVALGFAAHPVISEVVCWAKCIDDLMASVFVLAAARSLLKWNDGGRGYGAALVWFLLAVFSKESAAPFALAVFFIFYGFHGLPWQRSARLAVPFLLVTFFFAVCQRWVMGHFSQCPPLSGTYWQTLIDMLPVATDYWRLLWGIPPFCADYNFMVGAPPHPSFSKGVLAGLFLALFFGGLAGWLWRRPNWRMSAFGLIWAALFLLPVSNLVPMMQYMAERFLYLPLMGFLLALGGVFLNCSRWFLVTAVAAAALVAIWTGTSLNRMGIWQDNLTLFVRTELEHPGIRRVQNNAVAAIFQLPQIAVWRTAKVLSPAQAAQIIATLQKARRLYPENDLLTTQIGMTEARIGRWPEAVAWLKLAVRQNPGSAERWFDLASVYRLAGQPAQARDACAQALRLNPEHEEARRLQTKLELKPAPK